TVPAAEHLEVADARHRPVVVEDLADHAGGRQPAQAREVDGRLRVAGALENATGASTQREDVARTGQVRGSRGRVDRDLDRPRAIGGREARGDALAPPRR